jgi:hypothetical protein
MVDCKGTTKSLRDKLLKDQQRRAEKERSLPFAQKLRILDELMKAGVLVVEDAQGGQIWQDAEPEPAQ